MALRSRGRSRCAWFDDSGDLGWIAICGTGRCDGRPRKEEPRTVRWTIAPVARKLGDLSLGRVAVSWRRSLAHRDVELVGLRRACFQHRPRVAHPAASEARVAGLSNPTNAHGFDGPPRLCGIPRELEDPARD